MLNVTAKFVVESVQMFAHPGANVVLRPVMDDGIPENKRFHQATPSGELKMYVNNPTAIGVFTPGQPFYVTFEPVPQEKI